MIFTVKLGISMSLSLRIYNGYDVNTLQHADLLTASLLACTQCASIENGTLTQSFLVALNLKDTKRIAFLKTKMRSQALVLRIEQLKQLVSCKIYVHTDHILDSNIQQS
mgnify:CR=1 FL=1